MVEKIIRSACRLSTFEGGCPYLNKAKKEGKKQGAVDFGFWLVNSPVKNKYSKKWIEIKYQQYLKELKELK